MAHNGQWLGHVGGSAPGRVTLELDEIDGQLDGIAYHFPHDDTLPSVAAAISGLTPGQSRYEIAAAPLQPIDPGTGYRLDNATLVARFPNTAIGETAHLVLSFDNDSASVSFETALTSGHGPLFLSEAGQDSKLIPLSEVSSWADFCTWAFQNRSTHLIFRGQCVTKRLRTSFHRTRRKNLSRYQDSDINELRRLLAPKLKHFFNPFSPHENGAFYSLLQHHGYPTPFLDWTQSPFVAAFFAFQQEFAEGDKVRIFVFDRTAWERDHAPWTTVAFSRPHFSMIDVLAIENHRAGPQQALASITNIDDIESYISYCEGYRETQYLRVIDIPRSDRARALADLHMMGINAGSLFPGIEGTCQALAYKNFG